MIDTSLGIVMSGDLTVSGHATDYTLLYVQRTWPPSSPFMYETEFENADATGNLLTFLFPPASLVGYTGGILCGSSTICTDGKLDYFSNIGTLSGGFVSDFVLLDHGSLEPVPELSGTGVLLVGLAAAALVIRRAVRARSRSSQTTA